jgi:NodT family efflux transporter outer membrane factor (OMF) lipoprotein
MPSFALASLLLLAGCTVGPDFAKPAPPQVSGYTPDSLSGSTAQPPSENAQQFADGLDIPGQWWTLFQSKPLNELIERALRNNPDLQAAQASLRVAQETVLSQRGAYYPGVDGGVSATRQKTSADLAPVPSSGELYFSLYTPQLSVSYVPDVFGLNRRTLESLQAQAEQQRFVLIATQVTLTANVSAAAIQEASLRAQIEATRQLIRINTRLLETLRQQRARGYIGQLDVAAQESELAQISATLPPLLKQLAQQRHVLAALSGGFPDQELPEKFELSTLQLPRELPLSLPSQLVQQRPDVRQAEENLHAASARIGVAIADRLPSFALTADAGSTSLDAGRLFTAGTGFWSLGASLTQPIFRGGALLHQQRAAEAAYTQAAQQYRSTVLTAFQNVADTLSALRQDEDGLRSAAAASAAAQTTLNLATKQWQAGYADYLALLNAEQGAQQSAITLVQARAVRYADTVALFQALGGGWWNRSELSDASVPR